MKTLDTERNKHRIRCPSFSSCSRKNECQNPGIIKVQMMGGIASVLGHPSVRNVSEEEFHKKEDWNKNKHSVHGFQVFTVIHLSFSGLYFCTF